MDAMTDDDRKAIGDRVRAARVAAGYQQRDALAREVTLPRFGAKTIGAVERGERPLYEHEAAELARVLDVAADWFFQTQAGESQLDRIEHKLDAVLILLAAAATSRGEDEADGSDVVEQARRIVGASQPQPQTARRDQRTSGRTGQGRRRAS